MKRLSKVEESGRLRIAYGELIYEGSMFFTAWHLPLSRIRLIGELTTDQGPHIDDWFYCFGTNEQAWNEASAFAENADETMGELENIFGLERTGALLNSADYACVTHYPAHLAGRPFLDYTRTKGGFFRPGTISWSLTPEVRHYLTTGEIVEN